MFITLSTYDLPYKWLELKIKTPPPSSKTGNLSIIMDREAENKGVF